MALIAVSIAAAVPVSVPTEAALTLVMVLLSRVLRAAASTDESVTVIVYLFPVPVRPARVAMSLLLIEAVITPEVPASIKFASATERLPPIDKFLALRPENPEDA